MAVQKNSPFNPLNIYALKRAAKERLKKPSGYSFSQNILPPAPLTESESNSLLSILCNTPGVIYKPRHRVQSSGNEIEPHRWEVLGFDSHEHYTQWVLFNNLDDDHRVYAVETEHYE